MILFRVGAFTNHHIIQTNTNDVFGLPRGEGALTHFDQ